MFFAPAGQQAADSSEKVVFYRLLKNGQMQGPPKS
jgi:hypothetical protein